jgi:hydroxyacyl-ACP dehydratase HTD2-like protein with hotdog domain
MLRPPTGRFCLCRKHLGRKCFLNQRFDFSFSCRQSSTFSRLKEDITARSLPLLYDPCSHLNSCLLLNTLEDFLPPPLERLPYVPPSNCLPIVIPFAHHLVYFPPSLPLSSLDHDGTDPLHSPGLPFTRRMWAGGGINYSNQNLYLNLAPAVCLERITDLSIEGQEGEEKAYVRIERRVNHYIHRDDEPRHLKTPFGVKQGSLRQHVIETEARDPIEVRSLVFFHGGFNKTAPSKTDPAPKVVKLLQTPDFSHTLIPSAALLFRFSALTFNAHAIHLDKQYCQEIEGHRNLLVHGPLTVILMTELLRRHLEDDNFRNKKQPNRKKTIESIEYRNFAPLYAEEAMRICGRKRQNGEWIMWVEGKEGGLAVRGVVKTTEEGLDLNS